MNSWPVMKVGDVFDVQLGKMLSKKAKEGEQLPYLANFNVQWGKFNLTKLNSMHFNDREKKKYQLKKGDILMCEGGEIGRCAVWTSEQDRCYYQKALHRLRPLKTKLINPYFFYSYMNHLCSKNTLTKIVGETSIAHLTREKLIALKFPCPPIGEQNQIVKILEKWDTTIEKTEALIAAKQKQFEWLCNQFFTPNMEVNSKWEKLKIGEFVKNRKEKMVPTQDVPLFSLTIENGVTAKSDRYNREFLVKDRDLKTYKVAYPKDIVFNPANLRWGAIARSETPHKVTLSPIYEIYEVLNSKVDPDYLLHALTCPRQIKIFATKVEGTLIERMAVKADVFELCEILVPVSRKTQSNVAKVLNNAKLEINLLMQLLEQYKTQKRGLMQKLLTGEWRIKTKEVA